MDGGGSVGGRARLFLAVVPLQLTFGFVFAWGAVAPYARSQTNWAPVLVGAVLSAVPAGYGVGMLVGGRLADRLPPRRLCVAAWLLLVAGYAVAFTFPYPLVFVISFGAVGLGVGGGIALAGSLAVLARAFPDRVGTMGGLLSAVYAASPLGAVPLVNALAPDGGWLAAVRWIGTVSLVLAGVALLALPRLGQPHRPATHERVGIGELARRPPLRRAAVVVLATTPPGTYAFVAAASDARVHGLASWLIALAVLLVSFGNVVGRLVSGVLADRYGSRPVLVAITAGNLLAVGILATLPIPLLVPVGTALAGLVLGGAVGSTSRVAAESAPDAPHTAFGMLFAAYCVGAATGPLLGTAVGGAAAWYAVGAPALLAVAVVALPPAILGGRSARVRQPEAASGPGGRQHDLGAPAGGEQQT